METIAKVVGAIVLVILAIAGLGLLFALPTKWLVNYIFSDGFRLAAFGVLKISVWRAWALNFLIVGLFKSTGSNK
jgi:hypothetical protein